MLQNYSTYRVLQEFFDFPRKKFHIRELSRRVNLAQISVITHLKTLVKEGLIIKEEEGLYPSYRANRENQELKLLKKQNMAMRIHKSKLLEFIEEKTRPDCIVLFGSAARGEDTEESDVDLFIQAGETNLDLEKYEKLIKRKITLFFEPEIKKLSKELLNNIINGHVLYGYLKVL